ncbi:MAG: gas vesicle protein K [Deltaproteobacteria bacterium]|nr:gas vesicle protein K [Deltaproteobacteria bacterium]
MAINLDEDNLKQGILGLVVALVQIIRDALRLQAMKRMDGGGLTEDEIDRLGRTLMDMDEVIEDIIREQGITETVRSVRNGLDSLVDDFLDQMIHPGRQIG